MYNTKSKLQHQTELVISLTTEIFHTDTTSYSFPYSMAHELRHQDNRITKERLINRLQAITTPNQFSWIQDCKFNPAVVDEQMMKTFR